MKRPIQLLISNGETLESIDLQPAVQRNLQVRAKANKISLSEMIKLTRSLARFSNMIWLVFGRETTEIN
jgi:hypothetical protein